MLAAIHFRGVAMLAQTRPCATFSKTVCGTAVASLRFAWRCLEVTARTMRNTNS